METAFVVSSTKRWVSETSVGVRAVRSLFSSCDHFLGMVAVLVRTRAYAMTRRYVSSMVRNPPSAKYVAETRVDDESTMDTPEYLSPSQRDILTSAIRVDQAGEVAANWIYRGQMAILGKDVVAGPVIQASRFLPVRL